MVKLQGSFSISCTPEHTLETNSTNLKNVGSTSFVPGPFKGNKGQVLEKNVIHVKNGENIFFQISKYIKKLREKFYECKKYISVIFLLKTFKGVITYT